MPSHTPDSPTLINNSQYIFSFILTNKYGTTHISKDVIKSMDITIDLLSPWVTAKMAISNPHDALESEILIVGDGRDTIKISLKSVDDPSGSNLEYTFVINKEVSVPSDEGSQSNVKYFELVDINYATCNASSVGGLVWTDVPIPTILEDVFQAMGEPLAVVLDNGTSNKITLNPPANFKYTDLISRLLLNDWFESNGLKCKTILLFDHENHRYVYKPLIKFFEEYKSNIIEAFSVGSKDNISLPTSTNKYNPPSRDNVPVNITANDLPDIDLSVPTSDINASLTDVLITTNVNGFVGVDEMKINDTFEKYKPHFVEIFESVGSTVVGHLPEKASRFWIPHGLHRGRPRVNIRNFSPVDTEMPDAKSLVEADMVNNLVFNNMQLIFNTRGQIYRIPGKFIDIFKMEQSTGKFDQKLLGTWFIRSVVHSFRGNEYRNQVTCCKTYISE